MLNDDVIRMIVSGVVGATLTAVLMVWFPREAMLLVLGFVVADLVEAAAVPLVIGLVKLRRLRRGIS